MSLGDLIRRYRLSAGLSQEDLAERAGLSVRGISDLERGRRLSPHMETLRLLSDGLGLADEARAALIAAARPELTAQASAVGIAEQPQPASEPRVRALPTPPTALVGQSDLIARLVGHISENGVRLVTLTGPGGVGKTRVGLEAGRLLADSFADGALFLDLGLLSSSQQLGPALLDALAFTGNQGPDPVSQLIDLLRDASMLLILDNFEHMLDAATSVARILAFCPNLSIIVTSRIRLRLRGELLLPVPPLDLPGDLRAAATLESISQIPSVALFLDRARDAAPDFVPAEEDAETIVRICRQLDGLPLAIELAASWLRVLSPAALLERLQSRLPSLGGGSRDAPERHQTLRNTLAWSMHLLSDRERLLFRQLSIFSGGATLDALLRTTIGEPWQDSEVLEALSNLLDNSLIRQSVDSDGATRYSMLETIRAFGREQASETGEYTEFRNAHLRWIVDLAEAAEVELVGPQEPSWRNLLIAEQANIRAALAWAIEKEDVESGLRIAGALWRFWSKRGALLEGREWLSRVLALPGETEPTLLAKSSQALANMCFDLGDYAEAKTRFETSLAIRRTLPEKALIANALNGLGLVAFAQGDLTQAQALHRESLELSREAGSLIGIGNSLSNWADVEMALGNLTESRQLQEEGLEVRRVLGDENSIGYSLYNLGVLARQEGRFDDALGLLNESTERFRSAGDLFGQAYALCDLGVVRAALGDSLAGAADELESMRLRGEIGDQRGMIDCIEGAARIVATAGFAADACRLVGAASSRRQHVGVPRTPSEVVELERWTSAELSGEPNADVLLEEGAAMTLSQAVDLAHSLLHELSRQTVDSSSAGSQARQDA